MVDIVVVGIEGVVVDFVVYVDVVCVVYVYGVFEKSPLLP